MIKVPANKLNRKFIRNPVPTAAILEITNRCSLNCIHCIRDAGNRTVNELSLNEWKRVLDDLRGIQTFSICFSGGEPLDYNGFFELAYYARKLGMIITLKTNGTKLEEHIDELKRIGLGYVEVSLYGASPDVHEAVTLVKGSFKRTLSGIKAARKLGIPTHISFMIMKNNFSEIDRIRELAFELDSGIRRDFLLLTTDCGRKLDELLLAPDEIREVESKWPVLTIKANQNGTDGIKICMQGANVLAISAGGDLLSCIVIRKTLGNVREEPLKDIWKRISKKPTKTHDIDYEKFSRCKSCIFLPQCYICIGQNYNGTGNFYEPPFERCYITMSLYGYSRDAAQNVSTDKENVHAEIQ